MKMLTTEVTKLLDKLYNLRGEDSEILVKMETERTNAEETKERTSEEKKVLQNKIESLTEEERILAEEGDKLVSVLSNIRTEDFKIVLEKLNIDFDPSKISEKVSSLLPQTINKVQMETETTKNELVEVESEMNSAVATIEELAIRKDEALSNQARLNEYFDLALNGNINITRDAITSLLEKFDFSEDEQREAAKILMFPEDALYEYENKQKSEANSGMSISEVFAEAKENSSSIIDEFTREVNTPVMKKNPREELIDLLSSLGFDYLDFTNSDIERVLYNYDEEVIRSNVNYAKEKAFKLDMFIDNVELLYDKEFKEKINKLIEIGKDPFDIYLNPNILMKYNCETLNNTIDKLINSGLDPKMVPLIAY